MNQHLLDLFNSNPPARRPEQGNPFTAICGVNLFGQRALFTGFCACTGGDLWRASYCEGDA